MGVSPKSRFTKFNESRLIESFIWRSPPTERRLVNEPFSSRKLKRNTCSLWSHSESLTNFTPHDSMRLRVTSCDFVTGEHLSRCFNFRLTTKRFTWRLASVTADEHFPIYWIMHEVLLIICFMNSSWGFFANLPFHSVKFSKTWFTQNLGIRRLSLSHPADHCACFPLAMINSNGNSTGNSDIRLVIWLANDPKNEIFVVQNQ